MKVLYGWIHRAQHFTARQIRTDLPRKIALAMQTTGYLIRRGYDPRILVAMGFSIAGISLWEMAQWSLAVDYRHVAISGFIQGVGMGMVFIPLNASAFATLPPLLRTDGSSLINLFRSIGSSVGISVVTALLARNMQQVHSDLGQNVTGSITDLVDFSTIDRFQTVGEVAMRMLDAEVNRQAAMVAYIDNFYLMMWLSFAAIPLVVFMRKADLSRGPGGGPSDPADIPH